MIYSLHRESEQENRSLQIMIIHTQVFKFNSTKAFDRILSVNHFQDFSSNMLFSSFTKLILPLQLVELFPNLTNKFTVVVQKYFYFLVIV